MTKSERRLLNIYLRDHRAGAVAGRRLGRRLVRENPHPRWAPLRGVAREIKEDERTLVIVMKRLGVSEGIVKKVAAGAVEMIGRLKPNGQLVGYSPLSRVLELESLMSGVVAKRRLWVSLKQLVGEGVAALRPMDFEELDRRALDQLTTLASLHDAAARIAFLTAAESSESYRSPLSSA